MAKVKVYDGLTGDFCVETAGDGSGSSRMKSWLEEIPRWLKEAVEPIKLKGLALGRMANFPSFLNGEGLGTFHGVDVWRVVKNTAVLGVGSGAIDKFGDVALTEADRTHADYYNTTTDPDDPVAPRGASAPAFLMSVVDGGGFNLAATDGSLTIEVNGTRYSVTTTDLQGGAVTVEDIREVITTAGWPVDVEIEGGDTLRLFAPGNGVTANIKAICVSGDVGTVLFTGSGQSSQPNVLYKGTNGPLGNMDNTEVVGGNKPQRRILPKSVEVTATVSAAAVVLNDDGEGVLSDITGVHVGTIDYETGAIHVDLAGNADNSTNVTASWKVLKKLDLTQPARLPQAGMEIALTLKS